MSTLPAELIGTLTYDTLFNNDGGNFVPEKLSFSFIV
jgi:hypothetical protein